MNWYLSWSGQEIDVLSTAVAFAEDLISSVFSAVASFLATLLALALLPALANLAGLLIIAVLGAPMWALAAFMLFHS